MLMCQNKDLINETSLINGGSSFLESWYWSSSNSGSLAWHVYFPNCGTNDTYHSQYFNVRAVRSFSLLAGCTDSLSFNFDPNANIDNGSCIDIIYGCTDSEALNFDENANTDDGSCWASSLLIPFATQISDNIDGEAANDQSGFSVSMSSDGMTVAIGAPRNDDNYINSGNVRIFSWNDTIWSQKGQEINGNFEDEYFGTSAL